MALPIFMPKQDGSIEACTLIAWHVQCGDQVYAGDLLAEVESVKATFELEAPEEGEVLALFFEAGDRVPVLANVAVIGQAGEDVEAFRPEVAHVQNGPDFGASRSSGAPLSPRAQRFLADHPFDCSAVEGTGPGGRIVERDLVSAYQRAPDRITIKPAMDSEKEVKPLSSIRKVIGHRMQQSVATAPQYTLNAQVDVSTLLAERGRNMNHLLMYATIQALKTHPEFNAELIDDAIHQYEVINLGFACSTEKGLLVPVIKACQDMSLADLSTHIRALTTEALKGRLTPGQLRGGTFTVSNLGSMGITSFNPVILTPQVAILGICAPQLVPVRRDQEVVFREHITLSLTCDHRVIDGAPGARFLETLKMIIESGMGV